MLDASARWAPPARVAVAPATIVARGRACGRARDREPYRATRRRLPLALAVAALHALVAHAATTRAPVPAAAATRLSGAVVYGVIPSRFGPDGLDSVTARLDALAALGVDVSWLPPFLGGRSVPRARYHDFEDPLRILARCYAAGELTHSEYEERRARLERDLAKHPAATPTPPPATTPPVDTTTPQTT